MTQTTSNNKLPPIENREELIEALKRTAELEHNFMCMYLYAAFSLKKTTPNSSGNEGELEVARQWASQVYMVARQEMEHLSLVNSLLAAIGAPPNYSRQNFPIISPFHHSHSLKQRYGLTEEEELEPCDFPFIFEPFDIQSARRYTCMEGAKLYNLSLKKQEHIKEWCFKNSEGECPCLGDSGGISNSKGVDFGDIAKYYKRLREAFNYLVAKYSSENQSLFVKPDDRHQVEIQNEYSVYLFPVTDLDSAINAMELITKQGEGLDAPPDFDTHFLTFYNLAKEYQKCEEDVSNFDPLLPIPRNLIASQDNIPHNPLTRKVFDLFNYSYVTLLYVLTGLYGWYQPPADQPNYPHLNTALREIAFGPMMTMLIRSLGEVLVRLPWDMDPNQPAAPSFYISDEDNQNLQIDSCDNWQSNSQYSFYTDITFYLERFDRILKDINFVVEEVEGLSENWVEEELKTRLRFISQNVYRLTGNLRQIYQTGFFSKFEGVV